MKQTLPFTFLSILIATSIALPQDVGAQDAAEAVATPATTSEVITTAGISGEMDSKNRGPTVLTRTEVSEGRVDIIVDAYVGNDEFKKYPLKVDYYINNHFYTSQMRSVELPGPLGIAVGPGTATPPFNYTIVATLLHPNRTFTTTVPGAVFASDLIATLDCTYSGTSSDGESSVSYTATEVSTGQNGNSELTLSFTGEDLDGGTSAEISGTLSVAEDTTATGTLTVTKDGSSTTPEVTGNVIKTDGALTGVELSSSDGLTTLSCS